MTKKIMLIIIAFVVIAAALGGIYYASRSFHLIEMESVTFSWGEVTEETTSLNAEIDVRSYLPVVMIPGVINIEMPVYLYDVEAVRFEIPEFKLSGRQTTLHASAVIEQTNFPHWWVNFIQHEEVISLSVKPCLNMHIFGMSFSLRLPPIQTEFHVPIMSNFNSTEAITMGFDTALPWEIAQDPAGHFKVSPPMPEQPILTIESWELHWGDVTTDTTQIYGSVMLRNDSLIPLSVPDFRLWFDMNSIPIIQGATLTAAQPLLLPGGSVVLTLEANVDNDMFVQWWASHLQKEENTTITGRVGMKITLPTLLPGVVKSPTFTVAPISLFNWNLHTDIMGIINYEIAQALGKPLPGRPTAVEISGLVWATLAPAKESIG